MSGRAGGCTAASPAPGALALLLLLAGLTVPHAARAVVRVLIVQGLGGDPFYTSEFAAEVRAVAKASRTLTPPQDVHVLVGASATRSAVLAEANALSGTSLPGDRLILYLIGHGSYDGREYRFNLPGPDLSGHDLAAMLDALPMREQLVIATGSCSGALLTLLARPHRLLITATRNGAEKNATRFGAAFAAALSSPEADADKNGAISAREAYDFAKRRVQEEFRRQTLLASEHAVLQAGAGPGGSAANVSEDVARAGASFTVAALRPLPAAGATAGATGAAGGSAGAGSGSAGRAAPVPAPLLRERAALNGRIRALEQRKGTLPAQQYNAQLEQLLVRLAELQQRIDRSGAPAAPAGPTEHSP
jgi:hypothetical protein